MSQIKPDGWTGLWDETRGGIYQRDVPVIYCDNPAHVVEKLVEAGVLELTGAIYAELQDDGTLVEHPLYRIHLPEKETDHG